MEHASIVCTAIVAEFLVDGQTIRKQTCHRHARISSVRDDFQQIVLRVTPASTASSNKKSRSIGFPVVQLELFKNFLKEGKATVKLPVHNVQIMLSNCPPDSLRLFLATLRTKWRITVSRGLVSERHKLREGGSGPPASVSLLEEMSPLQRNDMVVLQRSGVQRHFSDLPPSTPVGGVKRRRPVDTPSPLASSNTTSLKQMTSTPIRKKRPKPGLLDGGLTTKGNGEREQARSLGGLRFSGVTEEQNKVLLAVRSGRNVFYTGSAGTGKSFLIKRIMGLLPPEHTVVTASTGVAACQIGGRTLHNFAGIGTGRGSLSHCLQMANKPHVAQAWRQCRHLIIDEISLVEGDFLDKLDCVARGVLRKPDKPFGGIQVILCGDFFQLPPIGGEATKKKSAEDTSSRVRFAFEAACWSELVQEVIELSLVKRQEDHHFVHLLQRIRRGVTSPEDNKRLRATVRNRLDQGEVRATQLTTHRDHVTRVNDSQLEALSGEMKRFMAQDSDPFYTSKLDNLCPAPSRLLLKVGAQVMLVKNLDVTVGLANGSRGVVVRFMAASDGGLPVVRFLSGDERTINRERWTIHLGEGRSCIRNQLPLQLAWAISIHKSQGMTLDCVELHLSKVFECGQAYVALSRCRSLDSLRVVDWNPSCVRADQRVLAFYQKVHQTAWAQQLDSDEPL